MGGSEVSMGNTGFHAENNMCEGFWLEEAWEFLRSRMWGGRANYRAYRVGSLSQNMLRNFLTAGAFVCEQFLRAGGLYTHVHT